MPLVDGLSLLRRATVVLLLSVTLLASAAPQRLALVVGNARLGHQRVLDSAPRDVATVAAALREAGFLVMQREDLGAEALRANLDEFRSRLSASGGGIGFIYITTLGAQVDGQTMLLMRDTRLPDADDAKPDQVAAAIKRDAVELVEVLHALTGSSGARALVVDAAWRHPLLDRLPQAGLAEPRLPQGIVALLGSAPGQTQGRPREGAVTLLARVLANQLAAPALPTAQTIEAVRDELIESSQGRQQPWLGGATGGRETFADAPLPTVAAATAAAALSATDQRTRPVGERGERPVFEPRRNAYGHAEGDTLSFRIIDVVRDQVLGVQTQFIDTVTASGALSANGAELLMDAQGRITQHKRRDGAVAVYSPAQELWWAAPQSGQRRALAFTETIERPDGSRTRAEWSGSTEVGALRTIDLPAGRFEALAVQSRGFVVETAAGAAPVRRAFVRTAWFAPKLGQPVAMDIEDSDADGQPLRRERIELVHSQTAHDGR